MNRDSGGSEKSLHKKAYISYWITCPRMSCQIQGNGILKCTVYEVVSSRYNLQYGSVIFEHHGWFLWRSSCKILSHSPLARLSGTVIAQLPEGQSRSQSADNVIVEQDEAMLVTGEFRSRDYMTLPLPNYLHETSYRWNEKCAEFFSCTSVPPVVIAQCCP